MRRYDAIDLMKLRALGSTNGWNEALTKYYERRDINGLAKLRYQIQAGMDDLAKSKMNTDEMNTWFVRLIKSTEITAKRIIKVVHPLPQDNPLLAKTLPDVGEIKKKRDAELISFLAKSSY